jgi:hypothetical protein
VHLYSQKCELVRAKISEMRALFLCAHCDLNVIKNKRYDPQETGVIIHFEAQLQRAIGSGNVEERPRARPVDVASSSDECVIVFGIFFGGMKDRRKGRTPT